MYFILGIISKLYKFEIYLIILKSNVFYFRFISKLYKFEIYLIPRVKVIL